MTPGTGTIYTLAALATLAAITAGILGDARLATDMILSAAILTLAAAQLATQHTLALQRQELARLRARTWE